MAIQDILKEKGDKVWSIDETKTLREALGIMLDHHVGALIVVDVKGKIVGILSERDILRECYRDPGILEKGHAKEAMSSKLIIASPADDINYVMGIMTQNRIRHLPIVGEGKLHGIISIGDVVKAQLHKTNFENHYLKDYIFGMQS